MARMTNDVKHLEQLAEGKVAVVTGASSGIGAAAARALAADGWSVVAAARRADRLDELAAGTDRIVAWQLDVTDRAAVEELARALPRVDLLLNNAGGARGLEPIAETDPVDWQWMYETNVLGTLHMTQALLPALKAAPDNSGLIINVGSVAAWDPYPGGAGYNAAKFGVRAMTKVLRQENPEIRVTEIDPGRVATEEFSLNRFRGDADRAAEVYAGNLNLTGEDVAETIRWVAGLPSRVNIDTLTVKPRTQV